MAPPARTNTEVLVAHLPEPLRSAVDYSDQLADLLDTLLDEARSAWPAVQLKDEVFLSHLAGKLPPQGTLDAALAAVRSSELYLACACAEGHAEALAIFETTYLANVDRVLRQRGIAAAWVGEVKQQLREKLFVPSGGRKPLVAAYAGRGQLGSWLGVIAIRTAVDLLRNEPRDVPIDDHLRDVVGASGADPELSYLKSKYRAAFKVAFDRALASHSSRERNILRHRFVHGLTTAQIGAVYQVHRTTVARWIDEALASVFSRTRQELIDTLQLDDAECNSIIRLVRSQLELSLGGLLRRPASKRQSGPRR